MLPADGPGGLHRAGSVHLPRILQGFVPPALILPAGPSAAHAPQAARRAPRILRVVRIRAARAPVVFPQAEPRPHVVGSRLLRVLDVPPDISPVLRARELPRTRSLSPRHANAIADFPAWISARPGEPAIRPAVCSTFRSRPEPTSIALPARSVPPGGSGMPVALRRVALWLPRIPPLNVSLPVPHRQYAPAQPVLHPMYGFDRPTQRIAPKAANAGVPPILPGTG